MSQNDDHTRILRNRYYHLIKSVADLDHVTEILYSQESFTQNEKYSILSASLLHDKESLLCQALTRRGISRLVEISQVLKNEQRRELTQSHSPDVTVASNHPAASGQSFGEGGTNGTVPVGKPVRSDLDVRKKPNSIEVPQGKDHHCKGSDYDLIDNDIEVPSHFDRYHQTETCARSNAPISNNHHVSDPPIELFSKANHDDVVVSQKSHEMEDAFIILFFTFITQQFSKSKEKETRDETSDCHHHRREEYRSGSEASEVPPWLQVDVRFENIRDYFPSELIRNVVPSLTNPIHLRLSVILDAFQQLCRAFESLKRENNALHKKGKKYDELAKKADLLESRLKEIETEDCTMPRSDKFTDREKIADLNRQLEQLKPLQDVCVRSEERCKQLVEVTQQWAIECDEKMKLVRIEEKEIQQLKTKIEHLERRVEKYKKYWTDTKDVPRGRVSDSQFDELRNEMALRKELYDQVVVQRDEACKKVKALSFEIEALKDHNVQLSDRAANFMVQAQAKEPSVREMSILLEQRGKLDKEVEELRKDKQELTDRIMALELMIVDLNPTGSHSHPKKYQALVTGHDLPTTTTTTTTTPSRGYIPPPSGHVNSHSSLSPPRLSPVRSTRHKSGDDDEDSLLSSDGGSGSFSSFGSSSEKRFHLGSGMGSRPGGAPVIIPQLKPRDSSAKSHDTTYQSHDNIDVTVLSPTGSGDDYTRRIRYPNHSKILVTPLSDEDKIIKGESLAAESADHQSEPLKFQESKVSGTEKRLGEKSPVYSDHSHFDPYKIKRFGDNRGDRIPLSVATTQSPHLLDMKMECPVCSFSARSESELQSHLATCIP